MEQKPETLDTTTNDTTPRTANQVNHDSYYEHLINGDFIRLPRAKKSDLNLVTSTQYKV